MAVIGQHQMLLSKYFLIGLGILLLVVVIIKNNDMASLSYFSIDNSIGGFEARQTISDVTDVPEVDVCPGASLGRQDVLNVKEFESRCSTTRLTELVKSRRQQTAGVTDFSAILSSISQRPCQSYCACPRELKEADFPLQTTALVSYPGSGNTWTRHLIQQLTGIHTGSVYKHSYIKDNGFPFEGVVLNMSVVKSHRAPSWDGIYEMEEEKVKFDRILILLRNPYSSIMAEYKRGAMKLGKVKTGLINATDPKWTYYVRKSGKLWYRFIRESFTTSLPSLVIFYEDLTSCLLPELVKIASFLSNRNLREFSFCCTLKNNEGSFHRAPSNQTVDDVYLQQSKEDMNEIILRAAALVNNDNPDIARKILQYIAL